MRDQLSEVGRAVVAARMVVGSGGNLSARIPGTDDFWVTAAGTWLNKLDRADFVRIDIGTGSVVGARSAADPVPPVAGPVPAGPVPAGAVPAAGAFPAAGTGEVPDPIPSSEYRLHLAIYRARPDAGAVVHLHPQLAVLLDALGEPVRLATTDHIYYLRSVVRVPFHRPGTDLIAEAAASASRDGANCLILSRHGCCVLADTVDLAHKRALYLEEAAALTYRALLLGRATDSLDLPPDAVAFPDYRDTTV